MNTLAPPLTMQDELLNELSNNPFAVDLFALMRRMEAINTNNPPWGMANKQRDEVLQFGQEPSAIFASTSIAKLYQYTNGRKPKLAIHSFGLFGPNGAMPLVFTEYVKERMAHHSDYALSDFIDIFHNRLIMLFYRAWADASSCANMDRREENFTRYIANLCAAGLPLTQQDSIPTHARWHNAGHLLRQARNAEGLKNILAGFFKVPVRIEEFVARWLPLASNEQTCLGKFNGSQLGIDAVLGRKVMSKQHHFRIHLGPLTAEQYNQFLPCKPQYQQIRDWVRSYIGMEFTWDLRLSLAQATQGIGVQLGDKKYLGWNTWLGRNSTHASPHPCDVIFHPEPA